MSKNKKAKLKAVPFPKTAPAMVKIPVRLEMAFVPDKSGLKLESIQAAFVYRFRDDAFAGGADRSPVVLEGKDVADLTSLYDAVLAKFCEKHGTMTPDEAKKLPPEVKV